MHCIERTLRFLVTLCVIIHITCQGAPTEEQEIKTQNTTAGENGHKNINLNNGTLSNPNVSAQITTTISPQSRLYPPPVSTGPGNYLETRRVQMEGRLQRLETQVNLLLEAQRQRNESKANPEQDLNTAIQYGLNCERGDTFLVCLIKKVVILRREMSGIRRDISDLGKRVVFLEMKEMERKGSHKNSSRENERDKGQTPDNEDGQRPDSTSPVNGNRTILLGTTQAPDDDLFRQDPFCPPRYERVGSLCYYVVTDRTGGVTSSHDFCQSHGGYLARPRNSLIVNDLANHLTRMNDTVLEIWVDGRYQTEEETWRWSDGLQIDSSIWGLPDTPSKYHRTGTCVLLKKELHYLAMPQDCGYHYYFVCQAEPTKVTSSP